MAPDVDATAGTPKGWHDLEAILAEGPVAALLATYLVPLHGDFGFSRTLCGSFPVRRR